MTDANATAHTDLDVAESLDKARDCITEAGRELHFYGDKQLFKQKLLESHRIIAATLEHHDAKVEEYKARARASINKEAPREDA